MKAIDIIHNEHRALAAALQAMRAVVDGIRDQGHAPDFELLAALIEYITQVPEKVHHPKEDDYLFVRLRQRAPQLVPLIDRLQAQHREGAVLIGELQAALIHYLAHGAAGFAVFDEKLRHYLDFNWDHLRTEENELLPQARQLLTADDWAQIDAAFEANRGPWSGPTGEFQALLSRIVNMVPPPYGVGPA
jgi:branched-chain amino acid transport system ATP-binding protein